MTGNQSTRRSRHVCTVSVALGVLACGVVEHPHDLQAIDTSNDFAPLPTAGAPTVIAGTGGNVATGGVSGTAGGANGGSTAGVPPAGAGAPPSGITINLGGVEVPKEKAIAFIHLGHSNMAGEANSPASSRPYHYQETHPHAYMYHPGSAPELAIEPETAGDTPFAGPGTALLKEAAALAPDYYFISLGFGKSRAYCSQFLPDHLYYEDMIAAAKSIKGRVTFGGIFIYLGITERHGSEADRTGFAGCINSLVTAIRTDVGEPNLPLLENDYEVEASGEFVVGGEVYNAIYPQIQKIPTTVSNSALVSAEGLGMEDDHHFNLDGQRTWAQRALTTMRQKGWFPWAP